MSKGQNMSNSIRWILNYRINLKHLNFSMDPRLMEEKLNRIEELVRNDKHDEYSWNWTVDQSEYIDKFGWDEWLIKYENSTHNKQ